MQRKEAKIREKLVKTSACKFNKNSNLEMVRCFQELVIARSWRFESSLGHQHLCTLCRNRIDGLCRNPLRWFLRKTHRCSEVSPCFCNYSCSRFPNGSRTSPSSVVPPRMR